jgi:hypothetical protein
MNMAKQIYYHNLGLEKKRQQCDELLRSMVGPELVATWWTSPNRAFDMQTPESVFDNNPDAVYSYLTQHAAGGW